MKTKAKVLAKEEAVRSLDLARYKSILSLLNEEYDNNTEAYDNEIQVTPGEGRLISTSEEKQTNNRSLEMVFKINIDAGSTTHCIILALNISQHPP